MENFLLTFPPIPGVAFSMKGRPGSCLITKKYKRSSDIPRFPAYRNTQIAPLNADSFVKLLTANNLSKAFNNIKNMKPLLPT